MRELLYIKGNLVYDVNIDYSFGLFTEKKKRKIEIWEIYCFIFYFIVRLMLDNGSIAFDQIFQC